jgi:hypothetical protein
MLAESSSCFLAKAMEEQITCLLVSSRMLQPVPPGVGHPKIAVATFPVAGQANTDVKVVGVVEVAHTIAQPELAQALGATRHDGVDLDELMAGTSCSIDGCIGDVGGRVVAFDFGEVLVSHTAMFSGFLKFVKDRCLKRVPFAYYR